MTKGHSCHQNNCHTFDGRNPANQLIGSLSHYLQGIYTSQVVIAGFLPTTSSTMKGSGLLQGFVLGIFFGTTRVTWVFAQQRQGSHRKPGGKTHH